MAQWYRFEFEERSNKNFANSNSKMFKLPLHFINNEYTEDFLCIMYYDLEFLNQFRKVAICFNIHNKCSFARKVEEKVLFQKKTSSDPKLIHRSTAPIEWKIKWNKGNRVESDDFLIWFESAIIVSTHFVSSIATVWYVLFS